MLADQVIVQYFFSRNWINVSRSKSEDDIQCENEINQGINCFNDWMAKYIRVERDGKWDRNGLIH